MQQRKLRPDDLEHTEKLLRKTEKDLAVWYDRHDAAGTDTEKNVCYRRIVELTEKRKELESQLATMPEAEPEPTEVTRERIAQYLKSMAKLMGGTSDKAKTFVQSLVEHHGLRVRMVDEKTISISLALKAPGVGTDADEEFKVPLEGEAVLPADRVTEWAKRQRKHYCICGCGKEIPVTRRHFWHGIPEYHADCRHKAMQAKRAEVTGEHYYNGQQAADRLGIGRTTLNRWIRKGKIPGPVKKVSGTLLFDKSAISLIAEMTDDDGNDAANII
jgi:excisionase family DNA binding protein